MELELPNPINMISPFRQFVKCFAAFFTRGELFRQRQVSLNLLHDTHLCIFHKNILRSFFPQTGTSSCVRNTAADAATATTMSGSRRYARITAVTVPAEAETTLPVQKKIAGSVIALRTAYGI